MDQLYDGELAKAGMKTTQYSLLSHVVRLGPIRPGALARAMQIQPSTLTRNLGPLAAAGWVTITEGSDARTRSVQATDDGRVKRLEAQRHWKNVQQRLNRLLGEAQVAALHVQLDQALAMLAADGPRDEPENSDAA